MSSTASSFVQAAVSSTSPPIPTCADQARHVLAVTARTWQLAPPSASALARRAPYGYVPRRARLRAVRTQALRMAVQAPLLLAFAR